MLVVAFTAGVITGVALCLGYGPFRTLFTPADASPLIPARRWRPQDRVRLLRVHDAQPASGRQPLEFYNEDLATGVELRHRAWGPRRRRVRR